MDNAISPLDNRYYDKIKYHLHFFTEKFLINTRVNVELTYFYNLILILKNNNKLKNITFNENYDYENIKKILDTINLNNAYEDIKNIEKNTNHDVKSVEIWLYNKFSDNVLLTNFKEYIHFGLTSQDINSLSYTIIIRNFILNKYIPIIEYVILTLKTVAMNKDNYNKPILCYTHGQPATPSLITKELLVYVSRLTYQLEELKLTKFYCKFGGATGSLNAHYVAFPDIDWNKHLTDFIHSNYNIIRQEYTTQIEHYDNISSLLDNVKRINVILKNFAKNVWLYCLLDYIKILPSTNIDEVGSSTMPHKINPINFENAEGNLEIANFLLIGISQKLPDSRLQRDLSDSTIMRNLGTAFGHSLMSAMEIQKGLNKIKFNHEKIINDLNNNWQILGEAIQTILRKYNIPNSYDMIKKLTRNNNNLSKNDMHDIINNLPIEQYIKDELLIITPFNYLGNIKF